MEVLDVDKVYLGEMLCLSPKLRDAILTWVIIRHCLHQSQYSTYMQIVTWRNSTYHGRVEYPLRGLGIGTALVQQSLHLAIESGCGHYFAALTTPQSQNIFVQKLGYVLILRCFGFWYLARMNGCPFHCHCRSVSKFANKWCQ